MVAVVWDVGPTSYRPDFNEHPRHPTPVLLQR